MTTQEPDYYFARDGWRWRLKALNGKIVAESGEAYARREDAVHGFEVSQTADDASENE